MKIKRSATAHWVGSGKEGQGNLSTPSKVLENTRYGFQSRFADGPGTNPEELLGAAHAGCFSMKLAFNLQGAGFTAESIQTTSTVILEAGTITTVDIDTEVKAKGLDDAKLQELAADAKANCPVSKLFNANMTLKAVLL
ncbi:MAG: OsmC family peroxiredoxin [Bacteroidetes bacterium]|nr:OsmC family peroxiredoxin [Bacteroidota bacterium]